MPDDPPPRKGVGLRTMLIAKKLQHSSGNKKAEMDANKDTEEKLQEIQESGKKKGDQVVNDLIQAVLEVRPEVPEKLEKVA